MWKMKSLQKQNFMFKRLSNMMYTMSISRSPRITELAKNFKIIVRHMYISDYKELHTI